MVWTLEILPKHLDKLHLLPHFVNEIYIASIPGSDNTSLVSSAKALLEHGKIPVPHICARNFESEIEFHNLLIGLNEIGVDRALLIGGGTEISLGPYSSVMDLLKTGMLAKHGINRFDIAGHPEGNPNDPNAESNLLEKIEWSLINKVNTRIITQWSFDPVIVNSWISRMRKLGIVNQIHIGIPGPARMKTLLNYARICGVKVSFMMLRKQGFNIIKMLAVNKPDHLVNRLEGYDQLHLFPFGGIYEASEWLSTLRDERPIVKNK